MSLIIVGVLSAAGGFLIGWAAHGFTEAAVLCEPDPRDGCDEWA